jgi:signal transduction histidine kinase/ActR/RegA family two-component response regulator
MQLLEEDEHYFVAEIMEHFHVSKRSAKKIVRDLQTFLQHKDSTLLYDLAYAIYYYADVNFTKEILKHIIQFFTYLYDKEPYASCRGELQDLYYHFQSTLFTRMCDHTRQIEERSDTARKILLHTSKRLSETLDTQELMIANISHEMRTSLNAIYGYLSIIEERSILRGEEKNYLDKAGHATTTLKALVSDILNVTKINSGQIEIVKESFWLDKMVLKCIDNIAMELKQKPAITLETAMDFLPAKVYGDQNHIMEIVINLLSNAVKYTDKGFIRLLVRHRELPNGTIEVIFLVKDSGIGMTPEQIEHIFSPYSRFKTERKGLGLGLHIARELSQKLDGSLSVESTFGQGSAFEFSLKLKTEKEQKIDLVQKKVCFYIGRKESKNLKKKIAFLQKHGAMVYVFKDEAQFINHLLTLEESGPDFITIIANTEGYAKFDALIYYLKTLKRFQKTQFIAEKTGGDISLSYFDRIYEYLAPISTYNLSLRKKGHQLGGKKKAISILAVDDTETNLEILKMFIHKVFPNASVDMATGGYEAIGMFKIKHYDLVFLDLKMPGLNGFDVLDKLKKINTIPSIYAFTADVYKSNFDKVLQAGFDGLLEKPLQPVALAKMIQKAIDEKNYSSN